MSCFRIVVLIYVSGAFWFVVVGCVLCLTVGIVAVGVLVCCIGGVCFLRGGRCFL